MKTQTKTLTPELLHKKPDVMNEKELTMKANTLAPELLHKMDAYWRAANHLLVARFIFTTIRC